MSLGACVLDLGETDHLHVEFTLDVDLRGGFESMLSWYFVWSWEKK